MKKKQKPPFPLRMDDDVRLGIEKAAKKERRSMNAWLQIAAEERLDRIERGVTA